MWCDSGLTVKYCEHLEEYETFSLHFPTKSID